MEIVMNDWVQENKIDEKPAEIIDHKSVLKIKTLEEQIRGLHEIIDSYSREISRLKNEEKDLKSVILRLRKEMEERLGKVDGIEAELNNTKITLREAISNYEKISNLNKVLQVKVKPLAGELEREKEMNSSLRRELAGWKNLEARARKECSKDFIRQLMALMGRK